MKALDMIVRPFFFCLPFMIIVLFVSTQVAFAQPQDVTPQMIADEIDEIVTDALGTLELVPGFALAIYTPQGTYARGFGITDVDMRAPASADTAFYIASTTKAFTALTMNILHHRGVLNLNSSLANFIPEAGLIENLTPDRVTLRNLLTHTHGLVNEPLAFRSSITGQHSREIDWRLVKGETKPNSDAPFGKFQYSNVGYNILTTLTDRQLGTPWQDLLAREIFTPAQMTRTTAYMSKARAGGWSVAAPHRAGAWPQDGDFVKGVIHLPIEKTDKNMHSAGGMIMSANDAVRWLELLVEDGKLEGRQIIPSNIMHETRAALAQVGSKGGGYTRDHYGLGWYIGRYRTDKIISHGGGFAGYAARISYMPDKKIGVASFANESTIGAQLPIIINHYIYDRLAGRKNARRTAEREINVLVKRGERLLSRDKSERRRRAKRAWALSQPVEAYVGTYTNDIWGALEIFLQDGQLAYRAGNLYGVGEPFPKADMMRIERSPGNGTTSQFTLNENADVTGLNLVTASQLSWFRNTKFLGDADIEEISFTDAERDEIVGVYRFGELSVNMTVTQDDGRFFVQVEGQDKDQLVALSKDQFFHVGTGARAIFIRTQTGRITGLEWQEGGQIFTAEKVG